MLDGYEPLRYDKLLLATGSRVRALDVPGTDLTAVRYLRTFTESDALIAHMKTGRRMVVVGAGWIGLEVAAAARSYGVEVTVVEMDTLPLRRVLGDEVAEVFANLHRAHGVDFRFGAQVAEFAAVPARSPRCAWPTARDPGRRGGRRGGHPAQRRARRDRRADVDNGIIVDAGLRTSDPDIYACGDVANAVNPLLGRQIRVEHWANALNGGPAAAGRCSARTSSTTGCRTSSPTSTTSGMEYAGTSSRAATTGWCSAVTWRGRVRRVLDQGRARAGRHERQRLGRHRGHPETGPGRVLGDGRSTWTGSPTRPCRWGSCSDGLEAGSGPGAGHRRRPGEGVLHRQGGVQRSTTTPPTGRCASSS